jgi:hypothetical protein
VGVVNVLDAHWVAEQLAAHGRPLGLTEVHGAVLLDGRITHPQRPDSPRCRAWATYEVSDGSRAEVAPRIVYLKAFPGGSSEEEFHHLSPGQREGAVHLREAGLIAWPFPWDPAMPSLRLLCDRDVVAAHLPGDRLDRGDITRATGMSHRAVRYQPETSAVIEYRLGEAPEATTVYGKTYARRWGKELDHRQNELWRRGFPDSPLRVARPLGADEDLNVVWTLGVGGPSLLDSLPQIDVGRTAGAIADAVGALHGSGVPLRDRVTRQQCAAEADKKLRKISTVSPEHGRELARLCQPALDTARDEAPGPAVAAHGDLHADQILLSADGPVLLDLDSMVHAEPELDFAEMIVDVCMRNPPGNVVVSDFCTTLLESYSSHTTPLHGGALAFYANAEFVNRCYRRLRLPSPDWRNALGRDLQQHRCVSGTLRCV